MAVAVAADDQRNAIAVMDHRLVDVWEQRGRAEEKGRAREDKFLLAIEAVRIGVGCGGDVRDTAAHRRFTPGKRIGKSTLAGTWPRRKGNYIHVKESGPVTTAMQVDRMLQRSEFAVGFGNAGSESC